MKKLLLAIVLIMLSGNTSAANEPQWFLNAIKRNNPDALAYFVYIPDTCPITQSQAQEIVERVMIRNGLTPLGDTQWILRDLHMTVTMSCFELISDSTQASLEEWAANFRVQFGQYRSLPAVFYAFSYGSTGLVDKDLAISALEGFVEQATEAYIEANSLR